MEKRAMAVREEQWLQTIAAAKQSGSLSKSGVQNTAFLYPAFTSGSGK